LSDKKTDSEAVFEDDLARLENIVTSLEEGGLSLDDSLKLFEEGQLLLKRCRDKLEKAQVKVKKLLDSGGEEEVDLGDLVR
jgi:exodeoxyribonuclease VII small subunit